jgi:hypothetical protein
MKVAGRRRPIKEAQMQGGVAFRAERRSREATPEWIATTETYAGVRAERRWRNARREARPE